MKNIKVLVVFATMMSMGFAYANNVAQITAEISATCANTANLQNQLECLKLVEVDLAKKTVVVNEELQVAVAPHKDLAGYSQFVNHLNIQTDALKNVAQANNELAGSNLEVVDEAAIKAAQGRIAVIVYALIQRKSNLNKIRALNESR